MHIIILSFGVVVRQRFISSIVKPLSADAFGYFDDNGVWQPKKYEGEYGGYNQTQTWSTACTVTLEDGAFIASGSIADLFDNTDSYLYAGSVTPAPGITHKITFPPGVRGSKVRIYNLSDNGSAQALNSDSVNDLIPNTGSNPGGWSTIYDGVETDINYISFGAYEGNTDNVAAYIEIDGLILADPNISVVDNSFYLDFSNNSNGAALGADKSGNGNDWTVNNLTAGGSFGYTGYGDIAVSSANLNAGSASDTVDGDLNTYAAIRGPGSFVQLTFPEQQSGTLQVHCDNGNGEFDDLIRVFVDGVEETVFDVDSKSWHTIYVGDFTTIRLEHQGSTTGYIYGFRIGTSGGAIVNGGGSATDSLIDTPTSYEIGSTVGGNYCTMNPLDVDNSSVVFSQGNLKISQPTVVGWNMAKSTMRMDSGAWYWEVLIDSLDQNASVGLATADAYGYFSVGRLRCSPWLWQHE